MSRLAGSTSVMSRPSIRMRPDVEGPMPAIMRRSVVLPQPEEPTSTVNLPSSIVRFRLSITLTEPKDLLTF